MTLRDLQYLLAVVEYGNFGRAAEARGVSQPTLSVQVRRLETELGLELFERTGRGATPTQACEQLLPHVRSAVAEMEAIRIEALALRSPLAGRLRLGVIPTLAPFLLPLVVGPLREALPQLAVEPWEDQTAVLLRQLRVHEVDAAVLATEVGEPDLGSRVLFEEPFLAALPPGHRLSAQAAVAQDDLLADVMVLAQGHCLREQTIAACGGTGGLDGSIRATSLATLLNMVAAGYGTTLIPALAAGAAQDAGIVVRPLAAPAGRTVRLVWRARSPRQAVLAAIAEVIAGRLRGFAQAAAAGMV